MGKSCLFCQIANEETPTEILFENDILVVFKDINPKDLLFVGDTIYTDIQLAEENNIKNCLVLTGSSSRDTTKSYIIEPDYIIESIKDLEIFLS